MPRKRPDTSIIKRCSRCKQEHLREMFGPSKTTFDGLSTYCRPCNNVRNAEQRAKKPKDELRAYGRQKSKEWREANPRLAKDYGLRVRYGIPLGTYDRLFTEQNGRCAICNTDQAGGKGDFHVDHCHSTGEVRALLCNSCNIGLGHFKHSEDTLQLAIEYLQKYS